MLAILMGVYGTGQSCCVVKNREKDGMGDAGVELCHPQTTRAMSDEWLYAKKA